MRCRSAFLLLLIGLAAGASLAAQTEPRPPVVAVPAHHSSRVVNSRPPAALAKYDWLQFNFDARHSGNDGAETIVSRANVARLAPVFSVALPGVADGAPAVLTGVATSQGLFDLLFATTKAGQIVALDARSGATVWTGQAAGGPNYTTSSPAVDPGRQFVYSYGLDGSVHKYATFNGAEVTDGGWPQLATSKPDVEKGSSALSVARVADGRTFLYVANGGYPGDAGDYQGHVTAIDLSTGSQRIFNAACSDKTFHFSENGGPDNDCTHKQTAVWARPGVVYDPETDRVFFATGNGDFDGQLGGRDWGDSVLAIAPDGSGSAGGPLDSYTPVNFQSLDDTDADLGSAAPAILPAPSASRFRHLGVQAGKDANLRLLALDDLSQQGGPGHVAGELQLLHVPQGGQVLTQPCVWTESSGSIWLFVVTGSGISGLTLTADGAGTPSLEARWQLPQGGFSPIVANGVLYYAGNNRILALDPTSGSVLWSDTNIGSIHWESPVVANGILYITDESGMLTAYAIDGRLP